MKESTKRERLRLKMVFHMDQEHRFRNLIEAIDKKSQREVIENILKHRAYKTDVQFFIIDRYDWVDLRFYGTTVSVYGHGIKRSIHVQTGSSEFESELIKAKKVPISTIKKLLKEASDKINKLL